MGLFRKKTPKVLRAGGGDEVVEVRTVKGQQVTVSALVRNLGASRSDDRLR